MPIREGGREWGGDEAGELGVFCSASMVGCCMIDIICVWTLRVSNVWGKGGILYDTPVRSTSCDGIGGERRGSRFNMKYGTRAIVVTPCLTSVAPMPSVRKGKVS